MLGVGPITPVSFVPAPGRSPKGSHLVTARPSQALQPVRHLAKPLLSLVPAVLSRRRRSGHLGMFVIGRGDPLVDLIDPHRHPSFLAREDQLPMLHGDPTRMARLRPFIRRLEEPAPRW